MFFPFLFFVLFLFFFNDTATTEIYTLSLHDALPISSQLIPIQLEDGTEIYIESTEDVNVSPEAQEANCPPDEEEEQVRGGQKGGWGSGGSRGFNNLPGGNGSRQESGEIGRASCRGRV